MKALIAEASYTQRSRGHHLTGCRIKLEHHLTAAATSLARFAALKSQILTPCRDFCLTAASLAREFEKN